MIGCRLLRGADPVGDDFPVGIVLRCELAAAVVEQLAAGFLGQRVFYKVAGLGIAGLDQSRNGFKILARLLFGPRGGVFVERLQLESIVRRSVTNDTAGVAGTLLQENWFDTCLVHLVVE